MNKYRLYEIRYTRENGNVTSDFYPQRWVSRREGAPEMEMNSWEKGQWQNLYNEDRVLLFHDRKQAIKAIEDYMQRLKYLEGWGVSKIEHSYETITFEGE